jgi:multisubunit Na+/H+ antiporter MnhF subunit
VTAWLVGTLVLMVGGLGPALWLSAHGSATERLVGVELSSVVVVLVLLLLSQAAGQSSLLIVPLVLVLLSFAGTLVFTRLLSERAETPAGARGAEPGVSGCSERP